MKYSMFSLVPLTPHPFTKSKKSKIMYTSHACFDDTFPFKDLALSYDELGFYFWESFKYND